MKDFQWMQRSVAEWEYGLPDDVEAQRADVVATVERRPAGWQWQTTRHVHDTGIEATREEAQRAVERVLAPFIGPELGADARALGKAGYEAYTAFLGGMAFDWRPAPSWAELPARMKNAWSSAGLAMMSEAEDQLGNEDRGQDITGPLRGFI